VAPSAEIDATAHIGPFCVIGEQVHVAAKAALLGFNHVGNHCQIGEETLLFPQVTLYPQTRLGQRVRIHAGTVIGSDGFGYVYDQGMHHKIPQVGCVIIEDEVEIGANVTIDRGALGPTVIGKGTKIDNLVQIGHNVQIGKHCILVAQVGVAGSSTLGDYVTLAGQVGVVGHMKIGDRAMVAGQSGVINDIPAGGKWMGSPAQPDRQAKRQLIALHQLPDLLRRVNDLEQRMAQGSGKESTPPVG
jgi:UDP-3-O-[3-hydroxymyristoyl] glucosamine N-acyltransferase